MSMTTRIIGEYIKKNVSTDLRLIYLNYHLMLRVLDLKMFIRILYA